MNHLETLREILADHCQHELDAIAPDTSLRRDLGFDSLDLMEVFHGDLSDAFGLEFSDSDVEKLDTAAEILAFIELFSLVE